MMTLFAFLLERQKYLVHPWPGPGNVHQIVKLSSENKIPICIKSVMSRQGRPVNPV